jgi:peptide/nickel transport system substrate-binding protein
VSPRRSQLNTTSPSALYALERRTLLRAGAYTAGAMALSSLISACAGGASTSSGTLTLKMPFLADMQVPDPDIMYEGEGVQVMHAVYDGLVQYRPGSAEIVPQLAESWTVSRDQLTYTFHLVPDVKFHDGTVADAASWVTAFERREQVNQGPAYMVTGIEEAKAADPKTLVVTLTEPNNAFLHYLACPWHPYAVSPALVAAHETDGDLAQEWLKTHDAGTGPYMIKEFVPGSHYVLERFDDYWGGGVAFESIRIEITPSIATQKLQLDQGAFDLVTKGFSIPDVLAYQENDEFTVPIAYGGVGWALWLNPTSGIFADLELRKAVFLAIDRASIVETSFGGLVGVQEGLWPDAMFPPELVPIDYDVDTGPLTALASELSDKAVDLAWGQDGGAPVQQAAELVQTQLAPAGLEVTVREMPSAELFDLVNQPPDKRPDALFTFLGGDALHVDTGLRILLRTDAKPLNFFAYSNPQLDDLMDEAILQPTVEEMNAVYTEATQLIVDDAIWLPFCLSPQPIVAHKYLTDIEQDSFFPQIIDVSRIGRT